MKSALKARRKEHRTVLLLRCGDRCAIRKRPARGLLAGLWEYPNLEGKWGKRKVLEHLAAAGFAVRSIAPLPPACHVFTHIEWNLTGWEVYVEETNDAPLCAAEDDAPSALLWVRRADLADTYSIPAAFGYFTPR